MGTDNVLLELSRSDLAGLGGTAAASITDVKQHSSYNWIEADSPTIAIPGCPPAWSDIQTPRRLAQDCGHFYIAQNQACHPSSPFEPLFRSLYQTEPTFDIRSVDIVSDRNNFRKLLSFVDPLSDPHGADSFVIKVEVVANTALFQRDEAAVEETIGPTDFHGFGHNFEKTYTHNEIQNSTGHHRIVSYRFGDLGILIRHETDAYIAQEARKDTSSEGLANMISQLALSTGEGASNRIQPAGSVMTLMTQGRLVSRESTVEIKTRSKWKPIMISDVAAQLWISQTPKLVRAYHQRGFFPVPEVEDVADEIKQWEEDHKGTLASLAAVIRKIRDVTRKCSSCKAVVRYDNVKDKLVVLASEDRDMLPKDLYRRWNPPRESKVHEKIAPNSKASASEKTDKPGDGSSEEPSIEIGGTVYENLPLHKLPSLASWLARERARSPGMSTFKHDAILLFPVIHTALNSGWRQILRQPGMDNVNQLTILCSTFTSLGVNVLDGKTLDQITIDIKAGKNKDDWEDGKVDRSLARDAAFQLVYVMLQDRAGIYTDGNTPALNRAQKFYNATLYIAGHLRTFKHKTRRAVEAVYLYCQSPTVKQRAELRKWSSNRDADESDATTSAESDLDDGWFGSDYEYDS